MDVRTGFPSAGAGDETSALKWGGAAAMVGAGLALVANLLHPRTSDSDSIAAEVKLVADSSIWLFDHFLLAWSLAFLLVGLLALTSYIDGGTSNAWTRVARGSVVGGVAIAFAAVAVDGMAMKEVADKAASSAASFASADAVANVSLALFTALIGSLTGLVPFLVGLTQLWSRRFDGWLCYLGIAAGALCLVVASIQFLAGPSNFVTNILFTIGSLAVTIWVFLSGWEMWQRAASPPPADAA